MTTRSATFASTNPPVLVAVGPSPAPPGVRAGRHSRAGRGCVSGSTGRGRPVPLPFRVGVARRLTGEHAPGLPVHQDVERIDRGGSAPSRSVRWAARKTTRPVFPSHGFRPAWKRQAHWPPFTRTTRNPDATAMERRRRGPD